MLSTLELFIRLEKVQSCRELVPYAITHLKHNSTNPLSGVHNDKQSHE